MHLLEMNSDRFRLVDPGDDFELRQKLGRLMRDTISEDLLNRGFRFNACSTYPEKERSVLHIAVYEHDAFLASNAATEEDRQDILVGAFIPYALKTLSNDDGIRSVSAMIAPVLTNEIWSNEWMDDMAEIMAFFLDHDISCSDGTFLDVAEFRFPLAVNGDSPEYEWMGDEYGFSDEEKVSRRREFKERLESVGVYLETDDRGVPIRALAEGAESA